LDVILDVGFRDATLAQDAVPSAVEATDVRIPRVRSSYMKKVFLGPHAHFSRELRHQE
jgi:hypothetical protein